MKKNLALFFAALGFFAVVNQAKAATQVSLADWCVNVNGDTTSACNGAGSGSASISLTSFDQTLEPASNSLGTVTVTLAAGNAQYVSFYADYDVDYATKGSFGDSGKAVNLGSLPAGGTYELSDPNTSNIFSDFAAGPLGDSNTVGTPALPPNECCDVAFALSFGNINVTSTGTVSFAITTTAPASGFYLQQTNQYTGDSIFIQETTTLGPCTANCTSGSPEPSTFGLGLGLIGVALAWKRLRSA